MNADSYFSRGSTHDVCEDYAAAINNIVFPNRGWGEIDTPLALVSDGCSTSPKTDFGSRILIQTAIQHFQKWGIFFPNPSNIIANAEIIASTLGLPSRALDATLGYLHKTAEGGIKANLTGDGIVAVRSRHPYPDGTREIFYFNINFTENAPAYLNYLLSANRLQDFLVRRKGLSPAIRYVSKHSGDRGRAVVCYDNHFSIENMLERISWEWEWPLGSIFYHDMFVIATDGLHSFRKKDEKGQWVDVPLYDVLEQVMAVKTTGGDFMKRRMKRFLGRFCNENGWEHTDDIGVAGIYLPSAS